MMAETITDIPGIPPRAAEETKKVHKRRHSVGKLMVPNGGGLAVFSRYLQTSPGSCHDFCKYGTHFTLETNSKSPRSPRVPKIVTPKHGAAQTLERSASNLRERRKSEVGLNLSPDFKIHERDEPVVLKHAQTERKNHVEKSETNLTDGKESEITLEPSGDTKFQPSPDDLVHIKTIAIEGEVQNDENSKTILTTGKKKLEVYLRPSPNCIGSEASSSIDFVIPPEQVLSPLEEINVATDDHARDSKVRPQSKSSFLLRQACSSAKQNKGSKNKKRNVMSLTSKGVPREKSKAEMTVSKVIRTSAMGDKKNVEPPSLSLSPEESRICVSSISVKKKKSKGAYQSKKQQENINHIKPEKSCAMNAKGSKNQKEVSNLTDQENDFSGQASFADIPEKILYMVESTPEIRPAESIHNSVHASDFSSFPSSSSKYKSMKRTRIVNPTGQSSRSYEKQSMVYRPKGIHSCRLLPSSSSFLGKKGLRSAPYGLNVIQQSLTSSLTSFKSPQGDAPTEHDEMIAQKRKGSSKMMYKGKPKMASEYKHLQGEKLNFQRGKLIEVPLEDCTPRRLKFWRRVLADKRNGESQIGTKEDSAARRRKFRQRVLVDNINADDNQNDSGEDFIAKRLKFNLDNKNADDNQYDRGEDCTPRKLNFRQRELDDNKTGHPQNSECDISKNNSEGKEDYIGQDNVKHIDTEKKKDLWCLYNNMIEETTSRLARTKTSKVKALVSAFETVISHLDSRFTATHKTPIH